MCFYIDSATYSKKYYNLYAEKLQQKRTVFKTISKTKKQIFITLITTYGIVENKHSLDLVDNALNLEVLFD
jgi:hypothetical protein